LIIENALYWLQEYRFDGLRLDAVHALVDDSPVHILTELAGRVRSTVTDRPVRLVLESEQVETALLAPDLYDASWNDDIHHGLHVAVTGETWGYLGPFADASAGEPDDGADQRDRPSSLARAMAGETVRLPENRDDPGVATPSDIPPWALVTYLQNHDQIGNRPLGDRIGQGVRTEQAVRAATAIILLGPWIPLLFMGEEWGASTPFPFFCDLAGDDLREAVRSGRRQSMTGAPGLEGDEAAIPDPLAAETVASARLDWTEVHRAPHRDVLDHTRRLLAVRFAEIVPRLPRIRGAGLCRNLAPGAFTVNWALDGGKLLHLAANLSPRPLSKPPVTGWPGRVLWTEGETQTGRLGPWSVIWTVDEPPHESP
jgi:malto-oligosyltrehalose trehalohydrolase